MKFKIGDVVTISEIIFDEIDEDDDDFEFLTRRKVNHTIGKVIELFPEDDMPITIKVIHSLRKKEIGVTFDFREFELSLFNEAIKRGEMYEI